MRIIVDADAMPGIKIIEEVAKNSKIECILISDNTHNLTSDYSKIITVDKGFQSVDMYLINIIEENDIVVSQDYGVAIIAISKKCHVVNPKGIIYTNDNIDLMMETRHIATKMRKQKKHLKGPKKRTKKDDERLKWTLEMLVNID